MVGPGPNRRTLALSSPQAQIWLHQALHANIPLYNIGGYLDIAGPLDVRRFQDAVQQVIDRHDGLRLIVDRDTPRLEQVRLGSLPYRTRIVDLRPAPDTAAAWAARAFTTPFPMNGGPLFDFALLQLADDRHWWFMKFHHLIVDGWAISLVAHAGAAAYAGRQVDTPAGSYEAFIDADGVYARSARFVQDQEFWRRKYETLPPPLLPRRHRVAGPGPVSRKRTWLMPRALHTELNQFAASHDVSLFHLFVAILGCCLLERTGAVELPIGLPVLNRRDSTAKATIGLFAVINPARLPIEPARGPIELATRIRTSLARDYRHHGFPLRRLNALLGMPETGLSRLFDVVLSFERHDYNVTFDGPATMHALTNGYEQNALCVFVRDYNDHAPVHVDFEYHLGAFDATEIEQLAIGVERGCRQALVGSQPPLAQRAVAGSPPAGRRQVATRFTAPLPSVIAAFTAQARRVPQAVAVESAEGALTYEALDRRANQFARYLLERGVKAEQVVAIQMDRTCALVVTVLGIMKTGAAFLPIDPRTPWRRTEGMLARAGALFLITDSVAPPGGGGAQWLPARDIHRLTADYPQSAPDGDVDRDSLAYVIFTSGSSGEPKGVMVTHGGLSSYLTWAIAAYQTPAGGAGTPLHSTLAFDATITAFFPPLLTGRRIVLMPGDDAVQQLAARLSTDTDLTLIKVTPAHLDVLRDLLPSGTRVPLMVVGGEALTRAHLAHWQATSPATRIVNEYGPTETVVGCTAYDVPSGFDAQFVPIGTPIAGARIHIVDANGCEVEGSEEGELWIGGAGVARGYAGRPDLTAERFVPDPFSSEPGARIYRSGDRGRRRADGQLEYLGRRDRMVKIHGHRIELGDVEAALLACQHVRGAAVTVEHSPAGHDRLAAHLVIDTASADGLDPAALRAAIARDAADRLPGWMLPAEYRFPDVLPLTSHAKVDHAALRSSAEAERSSGTRGPTPAERALAEIWSELLHEDVTPADDFFRLGGDSIVALQVVARARARNIRITLADIFTGRTLARVAAAAMLDAPAPRAHAETPGDALGLSPAQRWLFEIESQPPRKYSQYLRLDLPADLDVDRWRRALAAVVSRHDAFFWRFTPARGAWTASRVSGPPDVVALVADCSAVRTADEERLADSCEAAILDALDIERGPTIGAALCLPRAGGRIRGLLAAHHLAVDGVSWRIILEELYAAYGQLSAGHRVQLPEPPSSFANWTAVLAERIGPQLARESREYWIGEAACDAIALPLDAAVSGPSLVADERWTRTICSAELTASLQQQTAAAHGAHLDELILAALLMSFAHETGDPRLHLDVEGHGRRIPDTVNDSIDLSRTVGWLTTTHPLRLVMPPADDARATIAAVKERMRAIPAGGLGYSVLRYSDADPEAAALLAAAPAPQLQFNFLGQFDATLSALGDWRLRDHPSTALGAFGLYRHPLAHRTHLLEVTGFIDRRSLHLVWTFDPRIHAPARVDRLARGTVDALDRFAAPRAALDQAFASSRFPFAALDADALTRLTTMIDAVDAADHH